MLTEELLTPGSINMKLYVTEYCAFINPTYYFSIV